MRVARCLKSGFAGEPNGQGRAGASPSASDRGRVPGTETGIATTFFNSKAKNLAFALPQSKAMRQNRCSNLSAVIASPYEMRADHEGRRRDLFLSGPLFLLFQKLCAILARLFDKREVDDAGADPSNRASASGRPLQPIENTQNQREYLWGNLEKFANSLQLSSLGFNKIKGLTRSKPRLRFDSELFFGPFWRCQRPAQRAGCSLSGGIRLQRWIASPFGGRNDGRRWVQMIHLFRRVA